MLKLQAFVDWSRPSLSSPRLPVLGSVQSDLTVGPDHTEPYHRPGPTGRVEALQLPDSVSSAPINDGGSVGSFPVQYRLPLCFDTVILHLLHQP